MPRRSGCRSRREELRGGQQPQTLDVELEDDLAGKIFPGDRVIVNGILKSYQRSNPQQGKSTYFEPLS